MTRPRAWGLRRIRYFKRRARNWRASRLRVNALASRPGRSRFAACARRFGTRGCAPGGLAGWPRGEARTAPSGRRRGFRARGLRRVSGTFGASKSPFMKGGQGGYGGDHYRGRRVEMKTPGGAALTRRDAGVLVCAGHKYPACYVFRGEVMHGARGVGPPVPCGL